MISKSSKDIEQQLSKIRDKKSKSAFLESILSDPNATILNEANGHKTILFNENKGPKTNTWKQTKQMACDLKYGKVRAFTHKDIKSGEYMRKTKGFL